MGTPQTQFQISMLMEVQLWVKIIISPNESGSGDDAQIILAEDNDATYGMTLNYDGGDNNLYISGKITNIIYGPHLTIERNSGDIGMGTTSPTSTFSH